MKTSIRDFGKGYTFIELENDKGMKLAATNLGARIVNLLVPTESGEKNIVLGFDSVEDYLNQDSYIGATIGRTAGRIDKGQFKLDGQSVQVEVDPKTGHTLHGGMKGFELKKFDYKIEEGQDEVSIIFSTISPDGENGFPGTLEATIIYTLTNKNEWHIQMKGTTDKKTLFNPTNHVYFNLTGDVTQTIDEHTLWIASSAYAELASDSIPTGAKIATKESGFDFSKPTKLAKVFASSDQQKELVDGIDHPFFLNEVDRGSVQAILTSPDEKIKIEMSSNQSCVVIFTANFGDTLLTMHGDQLVNHGGITFETQVSPGAEKFESFGNIVLNPGELFSNETTFKIVY